MEIVLFFSVVLSHCRKANKKFRRYGLFEKLWQFLADLIRKGFQILEVGKEEKFIYGQISKTDFEPDKYILRSHQKGKPANVVLYHEGINYVAIKVGDKIYIPDNTKIL